MSANELAKIITQKTVLEMRIFRNKNWGFIYKNPCHDLKNFWEINQRMRLRAKQNMQVPLHFSLFYISAVTLYFVYKIWQNRQVKVVNMGEVRRTSQE